MTEETPSTNRLRTRLLVVLVLGVGFGVGFGAFVATARWRSSRPKPWNTSAVVGVVRDTSFNVNDAGMPLSVTLNLALTNTTAREYRIDEFDELDVLLRTGHSLHRAQAAKLHTPLFIPPGETVEVNLEITDNDLADALSAQSRNLRALAAFSAAQAATAEEPAWFLPKEVTGIALFDNKSRYAINVSKPW